jgi:holo-[acyl-carrier protein] synthase
MEPMTISEPPSSFADASGLPADMLLGTDLVFVPRLVANYRRHGQQFFARLLTDTELRYCQGERSGRESVFMKKAAGRIAVKEAVSKALGCGINGLGWTQGVQWKQIEVLSQSQSPPDLRLTGRALELSNELGIRSWRLSLSHDGDYAMATVIALR